MKEVQPDSIHNTMKGIQIDLKMIGTHEMIFQVFIWRTVLRQIIKNFNTVLFTYNQVMYRQYDPPFLYAQNCPDQPFIPSLNKNVQKQPIDEQQKISRAVRVITKKPNTNQSSNFHPHIIKSPKTIKSYHHRKSHEAIQHQRQLQSLNKRIKQCKNYQQRKKDKSDPIVYPPYFVRQSFDAKDVRIDGFYKKVQGNNHFRIKQNSSLLGNSLMKHKQIEDNYYPSQTKYQQNSRSKPEMKKYQYSLNMSNAYLNAPHNVQNSHIKYAQPNINLPHRNLPTQNKNRQNFINLNHSPHNYNNPQQLNQESDMPTPLFSNIKKQQLHKSQIRKNPVPSPINMLNHAQQQTRNPFEINHKQSQKNVNILPQIDIRSIINYIYNNRLYKEVDLDILKMRLIHRYGKQQVKNTWKYVMHLMERDDI